MTELTFLNCSRLHKTFPKHLITTGSRIFIITIGSNRWISIGSRYQLNWLNAPFSPSKEFVSRWPTSHVKNKTANTIIPQKIDCNRTAESIWLCDYNWEIRMIIKHTDNTLNGISLKQAQFHWTNSILTVTIEVLIVIVVPRKRAVRVIS